MGWREEDRGGPWNRDRRPDLFRRIVSGYLGTRDALAELEASGEAVQKPRREIPRDLFVDFLAERIGYEKFRQIFIPADGQIKPTGKHGFEDRVIKGITEALSESLTAEGRDFARQFGGAEKLTMFILAKLDLSASEAMKALVTVYGETDGLEATQKAIEEAESRERVLFRANGPIIN